MARASQRPNLPSRFHIIREKELNAFSGPGGHIYITTALMNLASDDELASVLSHEVSHIVARHSLKTIQHSQNLRGLADLFGSVTGVAGSTAQEIGTATATIVAGGCSRTQRERTRGGLPRVHAMLRQAKPQAMVTISEIERGEKKRLLGAVLRTIRRQERIENTATKSAE